MGCVTGSGYAVCSPTGFDARRIMRCPTCEKRRRFVGQLTVWYDPIWTCCSCGDAWDGGFGWRMERPFARGWRADSIRRAKARWESGMSYEAAMSAVSEMFQRDYMDHDEWGQDDDE